MRLIDLSHTFTCDMPVYPGDPAVTVEQTAFIDKDGFNDFCLHGGMHVGTHMDAPFHMIASGLKMADIPPQKFFGRGHLIDARGKQSVSEDLLDKTALKKGDIVLVLTGWSRHFRQPEYYGDFPVIAPGFAEKLVTAGVSIIGLDTPSPDRLPFPIHKILLSQDVLIIENMTNLEALIGVAAFDISAPPAKYDWDAAPVRVIAHVKA